MHSTCMHDLKHLTTLYQIYNKLNKTASIIKLKNWYQYIPMISTWWIQLWSRVVRVTEGKSFKHKSWIRLHRQHFSTDTIYNLQINIMTVMNTESRAGASNQNQMLFQRFLTRAFSRAWSRMQRSAVDGAIHNPGAGREKGINESALVTRVKTLINLE